MNTRLSTFLLCLAIVIAPMVRAADWPGFRGPTGDGVAKDDTAPIKWNAEENIKWNVRLPRPGNGSPIVANGRVFVTSAEDKGGQERSLYCFDRKSGEVLWVETVHCDKVMPTHATNPYGGTTPVVAGDRVVAWHATAGLVCYDLDGKEQWTRNLGEYEHIWGYGTSPIIVDDKVILHTGPGKSVSVMALKLADGQTIWKQDEPVEGDGSRNNDKQYMGSWASPIVAEVKGQKQIVVALSTRMNGYDLDDGSILWSCTGIRHAKGDLAYCSPLMIDDICFVTGGFRGPMFAVQVGGKGDITSDRLWRKEKQPQSIGSPVVVDGFVYRPNAGPGTIECINPKDGSIVWADRAAGANMWGSIVRVGSHLYVTNQDGTTVVFKPNPKEYDEVARNKLDDPCNATPAVSDGNIFIRTAEYLWCIGD